MAHQEVDRLPALLEAALELAGEHDLPRILERLVECAADVAGARYAALGVYDRAGHIEQFVHHGMDDETVVRIGRLPQGKGLLGDVIAADGPIRLVDLGADPRSCGLPAAHPPMRSFLGVPVRVAGRRFGNLYLTEKRGTDSFDDEDERLVATLAAFAAAAIEAAMLVDAERELALVQARSQAQTDLLGQVIAAQEAERARVARDLHDQVGQSLTSVLLGLRLVDGSLSGEPCDVADARLHTDEVRGLVAQALDEVRQLAFDLRPTVLDDVGLPAAVRRLATEVSGRFDLPIRVQIAADGDEAELRSEIETVVYRVVQESLTNVVRHARASRATVEVSIEPDHVRAVIIDDGVGFAVDDGVLRSLGLAGMRERALLVDGNLQITSAPGAGTSIVVKVPR
ncbi:GAF domain-containing sensor histidine kinase [Iamia sp. SCSIO 61187]|uniref:GAF domain-containing sensor histidine kinase n=1 Tax=Iamia sp. SCSIO 61187 TaxID=2722752 RepID=UPI001C632F9E|nr:GAF domain-containing sensor histidine kinase [Iamia sp. SCSIO 61187]QYG94292.1 GAF domain-containing sensor histidine kinase [Iamia sp. SCSIO 61187]